MKALRRWLHSLAVVLAVALGTLWGAVLGLADLAGPRARKGLGAWWKGAAGILVGLLVGWWWCTPIQAPTETPAPASRQADGSLVLERGARPKPRPAPHALPKGGKEERRVSVVVQPPRGVVHTIHANPAHVLDDVRTKPAIPTHVDSCECPPVQVDLSLVRMPDKTRRVVASSPDGMIVSGIDIPVETAPEARIPRWTLSAVAVADLDGIRPGALLQRRLGPVSLGAGAFVSPVNLNPAGIVSVGITW